MFWFKSCHKCHGDLRKDSDAYGTFISCLQCGYYLTQIQEAQVESSTARTDQRHLVPVELERVAA